MNEEAGERLQVETLAQPLELGCGVVLKNRLAKAAMSDSLGNGAGDPTEEQIRLYRRWSAGNACLSIIGEVQVDPRYPEKPGNLVLAAQSDLDLLRRLVEAGADRGGQIWPQLGHAGAMAYPPVSRPAGPSELRIDGLKCSEMPRAEIAALPEIYATAARRAQQAGFGGVEIHAGHGFLLSQFLSPLFNRRKDIYGGTIEARSQILLDIVRGVRSEVGAEYAIAVKINSSDQLEGGLAEDEALVVVEMLGNESIDLIDISGGTYFPGAVPTTDRPSSGPYYMRFAKRARRVVDTPLMLTGGFKTRDEAAAAVASGVVDVVGLARPLVLDPDLPERWLRVDAADVAFPRFQSTPPGSVTAWYTMRLTALANHCEEEFTATPESALAQYESRDASRVPLWSERFPSNG